MIRQPIAGVASYYFNTLKNEQDAHMAQGVLNTLFILDFISNAEREFWIYGVEVSHGS